MSEALACAAAAWRAALSEARWPEGMAAAAAVAADGADVNKGAAAADVKGGRRIAGGEEDGGTCAAMFA